MVDAIESRDVTSNVSPGVQAESKRRAWDLGVVQDLRPRPATRWASIRLVIQTYRESERSDQTGASTRGSGDFIAGW